MGRNLKACEGVGLPLKEKQAKTNTGANQVDS